MKLYGYFRSSAAYRVRIALNFKKINYEQVTINLLEQQQRSDEYLSLNPQGLVPMLELDDGTVIGQSIAILEYLQECFPQPSLYPADPLQRAHTRVLVNAIACDIHPLNNLRVMQYLESELDIAEPDRTRWYRHWVTRGFTGIESQMAGPYCMGEEISMADVCLVPQVFNARRFDVDMNLFPKIADTAERCNQLDAFAAAAPEAQPDAR